ncbi:LacI family transcriptional regulator [Salinibacterium sp. CAN_S4]|uniref:substrate-binding domain-containing protein n=1 Tax=Salinibacterium sp. CAN_S4 TaxID=2787727 RepID=UPI0018F02D52
MTESSSAPPRRRQPTLHDVARYAGVSHQTVSRLVRGQTNIGPAIREKIEAAIAELNYRPNQAARSLVTLQSHRLAVVFYERFDDVGPARILQGVNSAAGEAGYQLDILTVIGLNDRSVIDGIAGINQTDVAGIVVFAPMRSVLEAVRNADFVVPVYVESDLNEPNLLLAPHGNEVGVRLLAHHLLDLGHDRFFEISGPSQFIAAQLRTQSLRDTVASRNGTIVGVLEGDWSAQSGYLAAMEMPLDRGVTALVVGNDQMALGALSALSERGVRVPDDMSVVGFDDIPESAFFTPPLTTVRLDWDTQGRVVVNRLLQMIEPSIDRSPVLDTPAALIIRKSSGPSPR